MSFFKFKPRADGLSFFPSWLEKKKKKVQLKFVLFFMFCENFKKPNNYSCFRLSFEEFVVFLLVKSQMILLSMKMWKNFISSLLNANHPNVYTISAFQGTFILLHFLQCAMKRLNFKCFAAEEPLSPWCRRWCGDFRPPGRNEIARVASCKGEKTTLAFSENVKVGFYLDSKRTN